MATPADRPQPAKASKQRLVDGAVRAAQLGDLPAARTAFREALATDKHNAALHYDLALVEEGLGGIAEAAVGYTTALRLKPQFETAARRLSRLLGRFRLDTTIGLDPAGLRAALAITTIARQPVADAALARQLCHGGPLTEALEASRAGDVSEVALRLVRDHTHPGLQDPLLLSALAAGVVCNPDIERLLTAVRRAALIALGPDRLDDRALSALLTALVQQGWNNDHAWAETPEEDKALTAPVPDRAALLSGSLEHSRLLLLRMLYRPLATAAGGPLDPAAANGIKPKALRELIVRRAEQDREQQAAVLGLRRLSPIADPTSVRVAGQYEQSPYPRWTSLQVSEPGSLGRALARFFAPARLAFMDDGYDVLIAGAGTGQQLLQSAFGYGPKARVTGLDISAASLGYAQRMAASYKVANVELAVGDILDADKLGRTFDIVECVGVLHHMRDPWIGWQRLLERLKPGGLMYIGLYSAVARKELVALRSDPAYPGAGCTDGEARAWRRLLLDRTAGEPGGDLEVSRNFYNLNEFRDLCLHESEAHVTLAEIEAFLARHRLAFRGFTLGGAPLAQFAKAHPDAPWPGRLGDWARFEENNPRTFDGMYRLWCERSP